MPTKPLPARASLTHLKSQAKDLLKAQRFGTVAVAQRIREFHPRFQKADDATIAHAKFKLSDAQLTVAREYGFTSWPQLKAFVEAPERDDLEAPKHERIKDPVFRRAVDLLDGGRADELRVLLREHPELARQRISLPGANYFTNPSLLEFVAENPTRRGSLPPNIADVARVILEAGASLDRTGLDNTLALVASSNIARESGVQRRLIALLSEHGADASHAAHVAAMYHEFDAVDELLKQGATLDLELAAALGRAQDVRRLIDGAATDSLDAALAQAANHGHVEIVALLLDSGAHMNRFSPVGGHSHATPLHQAVASNREQVVRLLVERGADVTIRDIRHNDTPLEWAEYLGHSAIAEYLRGV